MSRPTLTELVIAVRAETRFHIAAEAAPVGSITETNAIKEYEETARAVKKIEEAISAYIVGLEMAASTAKFDRRRQ